MADIRLKVTVVRNIRQEATIVMTEEEEIPTYSLYAKAAREADEKSLWSVTSRTIDHGSIMGSSYQILEESKNA